MFKKVGDANPIVIVDPVDIDNEATKKSLKKTINAIKEISKILKAQAPVVVEKELEKK